MIKAIETEYKGYLFRSRLEARWAVFFDTLGIEWEYEPEGFEFEDGTRYLPDFWLPSCQWYVEVKPSSPLSAEEQKKIKLFDDRPPENAMGVIVLYGTPTMPIPKPHSMFDLEPPIYEPAHMFWAFLRLGIWKRRFEFEISQAVMAARQARFEYGRKG